MGSFCKIVQFAEIYFSASCYHGSNVQFAEIYGVSLYNGQLLVGLHLILKIWCKLVPSPAL